MIRRYDEVIADKCSKHQLKVIEAVLDKKFEMQKESIYDYVTDWNNTHVDDINEIKSVYDKLDAKVISSVKLHFNNQSERLERLVQSMGEKEGTI